MELKGKKSLEENHEIQLRTLRKQATIFFNMKVQENEFHQKNEQQSTDVKYYAKLS